MFKVEEIQKKIRWVFKENPSHFFKKNATTNTWDEYENNQLANTFQIQTYDSNKIILYSHNLGQYVELSDNKAKIVFGTIDYLDENAEDNPGYFVVFTENDRKLFSSQLNMIQKI